MERLDIAWDDQRDASPQPFGSEPVVDQVCVLTADDDGDVPRVEENIARNPSPRRGAWIPGLRLRSAIAERRRIPE
jgi:hypothetical protein